MRTTLHSYRWLVLFWMSALVVIFLVGMPTLVRGHHDRSTATDEVRKPAEQRDGRDLGPRPLPIGEVNPLGEDSDATSTLRDRLKDRKDKLQKAREDARERFYLKQHVKGRFMGLMALIGARFNAAIDRFERIADRIDSRIEDLEGEGLELDEAAILVDAARLHIADAQVLIDEALDALELALESDTPKEDFAAIRDTLRDAKDALHDARNAFREALSLIKKKVKEGLGIEALDNENEVAGNDEGENEEEEEEEEEDDDEE